MDLITQQSCQSDSDASTPREVVTGATQSNRLEMQTMVRFPDGMELLMCDDAESDEANAPRLQYALAEIERRRKAGRVRYTLGCAAMMKRPVSGGLMI